MVNTDLRFLKEIYLQNEEAPDNQDVINRMVDLGKRILFKIEKNLINHDVVFSVGEKEIKPFQVGIIASYIYLAYTSFKSEIKMINLMDVDKISFVEKGTRSELILKNFNQNCFPIFMQKLQDYNNGMHRKNILRVGVRSANKIRFDEEFKVVFESSLLKPKNFDYFSIFKRISFLLYRRGTISEEKFDNLNKMIDKYLNKGNSINNAIADKSIDSYEYKKLPYLEGSFPYLEDSFRYKVIGRHGEILQNPVDVFHNVDEYLGQEIIEEHIEEHIENGGVDGINEE